MYQEKLKFDIQYIHFYNVRYWVSKPIYIMQISVTWKFCVGRMRPNMNTNTTNNKETNKNKHF